MVRNIGLHARPLAQQLENEMRALKTSISDFSRTFESVETKSEFLQKASELEFEISEVKYPSSTSREIDKFEHYYETIVQIKYSVPEVVLEAIVALDGDPRAFSSRLDETKVDKWTSRRNVRYNPVYRKEPEYFEELKLSWQCANAFKAHYEYVVKPVEKDLSPLLAFAIASYEEAKRFGYFERFSRRVDLLRNLYESIESVRSCLSKEILSKIDSFQNSQKKGRNISEAKNSDDWFVVEQSSIIS